MADRVERLTNLLALLLETHRPLSLVEIAGELGGAYPEGLVARRGAFERDKAALRDIGVPIESEIVDGGEYAGQSRYWIDRGRYELARLDLDPDEVRALQVAVAATRPASGSGSGPAQSGLWKLGGGVAAETASVVATMPVSPTLPPLRDAVARRAVVRFAYRDVPREVEPYGLLLRNGFWYLVGFDRGRDDRRTYRVDRIEGDVVVGEDAAFERPDIDLRSAVPIDPKLVGGGGDSPSDAVVRVSPTRATMVVREVGEERVVARHDDGAVDVAVPYTNVEAFRSWVLGLMEHGEVLSPPDVRAAVVEWLDAVPAR